MLFSTKAKILFAKILYFLTTLLFGKKPRIITRGGINYKADLSEGFDLSLFLFGNFQGHVTQGKYYSIPANATIIDVGANFGIMALQYAKLYPQSRVYAFEPTHYAIHKFNDNLLLNPELAKRISIHNYFVSAESKAVSDLKAFSSWKVDNSEDADKHPVHMGSAKSTEGVGSITLDDFVKESKITKVDFIKIDTDGHEFQVFNGAKTIITEFRPVIIFEIGLYVMKERGIDFDFYWNYFKALGYELLDSANGKKINLENYNALIPAQGTIDILALPK